MKKTFIFVSLICFHSGALAQTINFDDGQPNGTPINGFYAAQGVTFTGAKWNKSFNLPGSSGSQCVTSIVYSYFPMPETAIRADFSTIVDFVTLRGVQVGVNGFLLRAYDSSSALIDTRTVYGTGIGIDQFADLTVTGAIQHISFSEVALNDQNAAILFDNMQFRAAPVPEPASVFAFMGALALLKRKRR